MSTSGHGDFAEALRLRRGVATTRTVLSRRRAEHDAYASYTSALVGAITQFAAGSAIIDTGKLAASIPFLIDGGADLRILYLFRDPAAIIGSWRRGKADPAKPGGRMPVKSSARALFDLVGTELALLSRRPVTACTTLRYERFVELPQLSMRQVLEHLDIERPPTRDYQHHSHVVAGNPVRFVTDARVTNDRRHFADQNLTTRSAIRLGAFPASMAFRYLEVTTNRAGTT